MRTLASSETRSLRCAISLAVQLLAGALHRGDDLLFRSQDLDASGHRDVRDTDLLPDVEVYYKAARDALRRGAVPSSDRWRIVDLFPGTHPLDGLEAALQRAAPEAPADLIDQLERDEHGLHRALLRLVPADAGDLLLVIGWLLGNQVRVEIAMVRGFRASGISRTRSTCRSPFSSAAPWTWTWSASWKRRSNERSAMPR